MDIGERKKRILSAIVEQYIETGEPVSSKILSESFEKSVSSATIRNEMVELAELGLIEQPHTSAGRIPTQAGYRYYVDHLMNRYDLPVGMRRRIESGFNLYSANPEKVLERASEMLAEMTNCAAISTTPSIESAFIRRIEMVPIGSRLVMVVLLTSTGILKNKVCRTEVEITPEIVEAFYRITARDFVGQPVIETGEIMVKTLIGQLDEKIIAMMPLFVALAEIARDAANAEVMLEGQLNLLNHRELNPNAHELMEFLGKTEPISKLISSNKNELSVVIGKENIYKELENSSIIVARYKIKGCDGGSLAIIGPTRINYSKLIPSIKYLTDIVGRLLTDALEE